MPASNAADEGETSITTAPWLPDFLNMHTQHVCPSLGAAQRLFPSPTFSTPAVPATESRPVADRRPDLRQAQPSRCCSLPPCASLGKQDAAILLRGSPHEPVARYIKANDTDAAKTKQNERFMARTLWRKSNGARFFTRMSWSVIRAQPMRTLNCTFCRPTETSASRVPIQTN